MHFITKGWLTKIWRNNKGFILFIFLMLFFRSAVADWYHVPTGSMQPSILIGDRVLVNKLAYDVKIPLTEINLSRHDEPKRGDVVVFQSKAADERLIKRVIGVPGDIVEMVDNQLFLNGQLIETEPFESSELFNKFPVDASQENYSRETLPDKSLKKTAHWIRLQKNRYSPLRSFSAIRVAKDQLWVMGDNRDNSADSRVIGMVPRSELIGRAVRVVASFDKNDYYLPRDGRYWVSLNGE